MLNLGALLCWLGISASCAASSEIIPSNRIYVIDGDTIAIGEDRFRLVGFDTPESREPKCSYERALAEQATRRARELIRSAIFVTIDVLPGRDRYGRGLARLFVGEQDLGAILIAEGLARPYDSGRRQSWCG